MYASMGCKFIISWKVLIYGSILLLQTLLVSGVDHYKEIMGRIHATGRIVGGSKAKPGQFPAQVYLRLEHTNAFCGGAILTKDWVLSAEHCLVDYDASIEEIVFRNPETIYIVAGELDLNLNDLVDVDSKPNVTRVSSYVHNFEHDLALLRVKKPFKFNRLISPVKMTPIPVPVGTKCYVAGWGRTEEDGEPSNSLLYVDVFIIDKKTCSEEEEDLQDIEEDDDYGSFDHNKICAGHMEGGKDSCQGDSGGGLICNGYLTGIVSSGIGCARKYYPGKYGNVYSNCRWITSYVKELKCSPFSRKSTIATSTVKSNFNSSRKISSNFKYIFLTILLFIKI